MSDGKATFEESELSLEPIIKRDQEVVGYRGSERRLQNRRKGEDRRAHVRFEVDGNDRRANHGRRHGDPAPKPW